MQFPSYLVDGVKATNYDRRHPDIVIEYLDSLVLPETVSLVDS
jgi:hypothetical protein